MREKPYTSLSKLLEYLWSTKKGIDSIIQVTSDSDIEQIQEDKLPTQDCILLKPTKYKEKYIVKVSSRCMIYAPH